MTTQSAGQPGEAKRRDDAAIWITFRESPVPVKAMLAGVFVNRLGGFIAVWLVLFLHTQRGFSPVLAGAALSAYGAGAVLGVLVGGSLADWLGPRRATLISMFGAAFLSLAILYVHNYIGLLVVVVLLGAVGLMYRPAAASLLSALTPKNRQVMIMALYRWMLNVGTTAAPLIGAALVSVSYNLLFWGEAITDLGYAIIAVFALPRHGVISAPSAERRRQFHGFAVLASDRRFGLYVGALFINALVYFQYQSSLPLAMHAAGLPTYWFAIMVSINGAIVISCELLMTKVTQRRQPRIVVMTGFVLLGVGMSLYSIPLGVGIFIVGTLTWTLGEIVAGPTVFAYPAMIAPEGLRGRYLGASQATFALGTAIGPAAGVAVWQFFGRSVWLWCGAACVIGLLCSRFGMKIIPRASPAQAAASGSSEGTAAAAGTAPGGAASADGAAAAAPSPEPGAATS